MCVRVSVREVDTSHPLRTKATNLNLETIQALSMIFFPYRSKMDKKNARNVNHRMNMRMSVHARAKKNVSVIFYIW